MVVCAPESVPRTALPQLTGSPSSTPTWLSGSEPPDELCSTSAVSVVVWLTWIGLGLAVFVSTIQGLKVSAPPLLSALSQPLPLPGPPLQPHQFSAALAVPPRTPRPLLLLTPALFPKKRLAVLVPRLSVPPPR